MTYRLTYHKEVGDELFEAWEWYESKKKGLGDAFMDEFEGFIDLIGENPFLFQKLNEKVRRCPMSRKPGYWDKRI